MNQALVKKIKIINILRDEGKSFWNLETGNWSQELETGNWKLESMDNGQWTTCLPGEGLCERGRWTIEN
jgi:hypothetical protein